MVSKDMVKRAQGLNNKVITCNMHGTPDCVMDKLNLASKRQALHAPTRPEVKKIPTIHNYENMTSGHVICF